MSDIHPEQTIDMSDFSASDRGLPVSVHPPHFRARMTDSFGGPA